MRPSSRPKASKPGGSSQSASASHSQTPPGDGTGSKWDPDKRATILRIRFFATAHMELCPSNHVTYCFFWPLISDLQCNWTLWEMWNICGFRIGDRRAGFGAYALYLGTVRVQSIQIESAFYGSCTKDLSAGLGYML